MVSKAREDLPLPERPVTTTITSRGRETVTSFRLCSRAPRTTIWLSAIAHHPFSFLALPASIRPPRGRPKNHITRGEFLAPAAPFTTGGFAILAGWTHNDT